MSDHLPCLTPAGLPDGRWTSFACAAHDQGQRRAGTVANVSIQIRYCTATTTDKPFGEMRNFIGSRGSGALADEKKPAQRDHSHAAVWTRVVTAGFYGASTNNPNGVFIGTGALFVGTLPPITISSAEVSDNQFTVSWSSVAGNSYNVYTTTNLTPEQIHELGLKQIDEIEAEMFAIAHQLGFKDIAALNEHIKTDRSFYATSGQQVLDLYTDYVNAMEPELPKLFGRLPKSKLAVIPMEASRAKDSVPADYTDGAPDGSRPGHINVNEYDPEHRLTLNIEAIAYHEGIPGHHLQISIAQELQNLPDFRRNADYTAFVEGWALYSERLGREVGRYQDPYSNYGRLENEMWRAIRLVVDTGVHDKHWSRDQMVAYFHRYTAMDEPNIQTEVDRYIAWPGQALAYKLGQLEILKLREQAHQQLGDKFDLRAFHDEILANGALPLDVLDSEVSAWINTHK